LADPKIICKEMGLTHQEFFVELPRLLAGEPFSCEGSRVCFHFAGKRVEIALGQEVKRVLSRSMQIPVTPVKISLYSFSAEEQESFLERFTRIFFKGGG